MSGSRGLDLEPGQHMPTARPTKSEHQAWKRASEVQRDRNQWAAKQMTMTGTLARMGIADEPFKPRSKPRRRAQGGAK